MTPNDIIKIASSRFGQLEAPASSVIDIVPGLIGFAQFRQYVLLEYNPPFSWMQSVENPDLAFAVVNAAEFGEHYDFQLPVGDREIELEADDEVSILVLVSVRSDPKLTTVNLKAPVIINVRNRKGRQIVLDDPRFSARMSLLSPESDSASESGEKSPQSK